MPGRIARSVVGFLVVLGMFLPTAQPLPAGRLVPASAAMADDLPVEAHLSIANPLEVDANRWPIRYWVLADQQIGVELRGERSDRQAASLALEILLPPELEHTAGALKAETSGQSAILSAGAVARRTGDLTIEATVTDRSSGFASTTRMLVSVVDSADKARLQRLEAQKPPPPAQVQQIVDGSPLASSSAVTQPPAYYARLHGIVYTYQFASGLSYMLRGIQVQIWEDAATDLLLDTLYTVELTVDFDYGLTHRNWVSAGAWTHDDDSGSFDFGNVWVGSDGKDLYLKVQFLFHDGGDGQSTAGTQKLVVREAWYGTGAKSPSDTSCSSAALALYVLVVGLWVRRRKAQHRNAEVP